MPIDPVPPPDPGADTHAQLAAARAEIDRLKAEQAGEHKRRAIDAAIAGAMDPEAARLLIERAIETAEPDELPRAISAAARALRAAKPYLFPSGASASSSAAAPPADEIAQAAQRARESGDRRDLIRYLRLRKQT